MQTRYPRFVPALTNHRTSGLQGAQRCAEGIGGPGTIEVHTLEAVLGLSLTPTTVGWVLAEGHGADGIILDHNELELRDDRDNSGVRAVSTANQVADEVLRVDAAATASDRRLRVIGVTWTNEASAEAALLLESLTDAGFDNVVPIRLLEAVERLARAIAPVIGYEQTAVCILEHEWATVAMVDTHDGETQTATKHVRGGFDGLTTWLTGMFDRNGWRPGGVVVVGSDDDINALSWQLDEALPVPIFAQTMAQVTVARGAALAAAQSTEFTDAELWAEPAEPIATPVRRPRQLFYAGALTALAAGTITFVSSLSLALGLQLAPDNDSGAKHGVHPSTPPIAAAVPSPRQAAPSELPRVSVTAVEPSAQTTAPFEQQSGSTEPKPDPDNRQPFLSRVLEHIPGAYDSGSNAPAQP